MPTYTADWFSDHIPLWERLLEPYRGRPHLRFLEVGSFEGRSAVWLLSNILTHPTSRLYCVDTFEGSDEHREMGLDLSSIYQRFVANVAPFGDRVRVLRGPSQRVLRSRRLRSASLDFAYIDGSHRARDVLEDAVLVYRLLRPGALLIFDDYGWQPERDETARPQLAIDAFLSVYRGAYVLLHQGYQVAIVKAFEAAAGAAGVPADHGRCHSGGPGA